MRGNKKYNINIYGLKSGSHYFDFEYDDELFSIDEFSEVEKGSGSCNVHLERTDTFITLNFKIEGSVGLICDRSLEPFDLEINLDNKLILKYGEELDESDDEIWIIPDTTQIFNIERNIFEFINVAIPMKRLHPDLEADDSDETTLVYSSEVEEEPKEETEETVDPRWAALKNLKK
jgi:uncharacterized protein